MFISEAIEQLEAMHKKNGDGHIYMQIGMELNPNFSLSDMEIQDDVFRHYVILSDED